MEPLTCILAAFTEYKLENFEYSVALQGIQKSQFNHTRTLLLSYCTILLKFATFQL